MTDLPDWQIISGDALEVIPTLSAFSFDAVITDPNYGIGAGEMNLGFSQSSRMEKSDWDSEPPSPELLSTICALAPTVVIWGGNYFSLPPTRGFLIWDKGASFQDRSFSECEYAWTNLDRPARIYRRDPLARGDYANRIHKTQKPLALMLWVIDTCTNPGDLVLDPFCGSATTGAACLLRGRRFIGIEKDHQMAEKAALRLTKAAEEGQQLKLVF